VSIDAAFPQLLERYPRFCSGCFIPISKVQSKEMLVKSDVDLYLVCSFPPTDAAVKTPYTLYGSCFGLVSGTVTG
jgi:hypothetical protein